jgi:hypothetical protein
MAYHILNYQDDRPISYVMDSDPDWKADSGPGWQHFGPPDGFGSPIRKTIGFDAGERGTQILSEGGPRWSSKLLGPGEGNGPMLH